MRKKQPLWGDERDWMRYVMSYRLGEPGKASRAIAFKKALYAAGHTVCKPFRKK